jgi:uncharacterized membrane protein YgcG
MHNLAFAQQNVTRMKEHAERALAHDKNWVAAKTAVTLAGKNLDVVREQARQQTMAKPEYQALAQVLEQKGSESQTADARIKMATMVWDDQHNSSDCLEAQARLHEAQADVDARWKDYETHVLANNREWTSALSALDAARAQVSAAMGAHRSGQGRSSSMSSRGSGGRSSSMSSRGSGGRSSSKGSHGSRSSY